MPTRLQPGVDDLVETHAALSRVRVVASVVVRAVACVLVTVVVAAVVVVVPTFHDGPQMPAPRVDTARVERPLPPQPAPEAHAPPRRHRCCPPAILHRVPSVARAQHHTMHVGAARLVLFREGYAACARRRTPENRVRAHSVDSFSRHARAPTATSAAVCTSVRIEIQREFGNAMVRVALGVVAAPHATRECSSRHQCTALVSITTRFVFRFKHEWKLTPIAHIVFVPVRRNAAFPVNLKCYLGGHKSETDKNHQLHKVFR
mmetsp:Transcript_3610/g.7685  ORF Transcript_3610/g.7685 Transcript_3610/m.7685 type:complete len:261 (+) Transcript_3610:335-1117(+)